MRFRLVPVLAVLVGVHSTGSSPAQAASSASPHADLAAQAPADVRDLDAQVDQLWTFPTAETHPAGTVYVGTHEGFLWQVGVAITERLQFTVTPLVAPTELLGLDGSIKAVLYRAGPWRLALSAGATMGRRYEQNVRLGPLTQFCLTPSCNSSLHLGLLGVMLLNPEPDAPSDDSLPKGVYFSGGWRQSIIPHLALVTDVLGLVSVDPGLPETTSSRGVSLGSDLELVDFTIATAGLRVHFPSWAVGAAALTTFEIGRGNARVLPWVSATVRLPVF